MRVKFLFEIIVFFVLFLALSSCSDAPKSGNDIVYSVRLPNIRLGDGVPLDVDIYLRWEIENPSVFYGQFSTADTFNRLVLFPRAMELSATVANHFPSVDSVFASQRELFLDEVKQALIGQLGEDGITIEEVIVTNLSFPKSYTDAMEKVGMKRQLLEGIRQQNVVDLEQAVAQRKKAEADGLVAIAEAEAEGKVARIEAKTEENRRLSELARAETAAQKLRKMALAQADSVRMINKADIEKLADLKDLDLQKKRQMDDLEIEKSRKQKRADLDDNIELATVVQNNPNFASFLINKELASKVGIAVLPTGSDPNVFSGLLQQKMKEDKN
jgi:regulator of protease activity HflC (stomatin/prohibitin superfamily)